MVANLRQSVFVFITIANGTNSKSYPQRLLGLESILNPEIPAISEKYHLLYVKQITC